MKKFACRLWVLLSSTLGFACGGAENTAPVLSNLVVTSSVTRGVQSNGSVDLMDPDGLDGIVLLLAFRGPSMIDLEVPVQGASSEMTAASVQLPFALSPAAGSGTYALSVQAKDSEGAVSNTVEATFDAD
jgi:hypothetical protein